MGRILSKRKGSDNDLKNIATSRKSSCGLTEYWNIKKQNFNCNYFKDSKLLPAKASNFRISTLLDKGAFGSVALTIHNKTGKTYATKVIAKKKIIKNELVERVYNEKRVLESIDFPFVIRLEYFYQDNSYLYFVMPFICGGNLYTYAKRYGKMDEDKARFYVSEILLSIEYLHKLNLVHRDIKPENILIDDSGHVRLADFGFCKYIKGRTYTFCGTAEYIAPEIILRQGYGKTVDYWALGVLLFEMVAGRTPFAHRNTQRMYKSIVEGKYSCPIGFSGDLMNLLRNILKVDVTKRYGNLLNGVRDIKKHRWFQPIKWCALINKQLDSPFVPTINGTNDTSNFDEIPGNIFFVSSQGLYDEAFKDF